MRELEQLYHERQRRLQEIEVAPTIRKGAAAKKTTSKGYGLGSPEGAYDEVPFQRAQAKRVKVNKEEQKKSYKEKFNAYLEKKIEEIQNPSPKAEKPKNFELYKCTSPNPVRAISPNKWDAANIIENDKKSPKVPEEKKQKPIWGSDGLETATQTKKSETRKVQSAKKDKEASQLKSPKYEEEVYDDDKMSESEVRLLQWVFNLMQKV